MENFSVAGVVVLVVDVLGGLDLLYNIEVSG
jgi:hypothetical protein